MQAEKEKMRGFGERAFIDEKGRLSFDIEKNTLDKQSACGHELSVFSPSKNAFSSPAKADDESQMIDEED